MYRPWITKSFHIPAAEEHVKAKNEALGKVEGEGSGEEKRGVGTE
jgi:hypothetical protein